MTLRYFEDFAEGDRLDIGTHRITAEEIIEFAEQFDPAPFHLSHEGGQASMLGALSASGWQTCAILMRMMCDSFLLETASQGAPGVETCSWLAPVHPGDTLHGAVNVVSARRSASRPGLGIVGFRCEVFNQREEKVLTMETALLAATADAPRQEVQ